MRAFICCLFFVIATANTVQADPPRSLSRAQLGVESLELAGSGQLAIDEMAAKHLISNDIRRSLALLDGEILFGLGDFELTPEGHISLDRLISKLERFDAILSIRIIGHTDDVGHSDYNLRLSQRRADWIKARFALQHPDTHILSVGAGESAPLVSNTTAPGRQRNRRVEVQVIATGKAPFEQ